MDLGHQGPKIVFTWQTDYNPMEDDCQLFYFVYQLIELRENFG